MKSQPDSLIRTDSNVVDADKVSVIKRPMAALVQDFANRLQRALPLSVLLAKTCYAICARFCCLLATVHHSIHRQTFWKILNRFFCGCSRKLKDVRNA